MCSLAFWCIFLTSFFFHRMFIYVCVRLFIWSVVIFHVPLFLHHILFHWIWFTTILVNRLLYIIRAISIFIISISFTFHFNTKRVFLISFRRPDVDASYSFFCCWCCWCRRSSTMKTNLVFVLVHINKKTLNNAQHPKQINQNSKTIVERIKVRTRQMMKNKNAANTKWY